MSTIKQSLLEQVRSAFLGQQITAISGSYDGKLVSLFVVWADDTIEVEQKVPWENKSKDSFVNVVTDMVGRAISEYNTRYTTPRFEAFMNLVTDGD
jgi:hypothetical protein